MTDSLTADDEDTIIKPKRSRLPFVLLAVFLCTGLASFAVYHFRYEIGLLKLAKLTKEESKPLTKPDIKRYEGLKQKLAEDREALAKKYKLARTRPQQKAILAESSELLNSTLPEMMRCWIGTPWDFNGTAPGPGKGQIACGYFVSTTLKNAGFKVNRYTLAQQPSQNILHTFVDRSRTKIRAGLSYARFLEFIKSMPKGIYIVGLDNHVGFIVHEGSKLRFIHSSPMKPKAVVDESEANAKVLINSNYRVFGNITAEESALEKWLMQETFTVKK